MDNMDLFPLMLSFQVAFIASIIGLIIGLPIAWLLGKSKGRWVEVVDSLLTLPMILPPTVLGYYLLVLLGRNSVIGQFFESLGLPLIFTIRGVIIAATVVSIPYFIKTARTAIEGVSKDLLDVARVLGRNEVEIFFHVILPNAWRGITAGIVLMFARALGDFGTTLMVAGSIPGVTMTMPIAIYNAMLAGEQGKANTLVLIMTITAFIVLIAINLLNRKVWSDQR
ncbi:molybdate ABC transporter permease subunit [Heliorestis acidaminivorans]|uniref:Molybdenum transport system permease n=1 Tax=Heliorestis acidaminivorans TaxID=553427 RepID=A0A6I0F2K7_9FIRM|nr:molybdate ABC transporter permease subunit [Heliorestis acidaminivorans]KAB2954221.1 molybdate ABC transporter permease subunit [Heliorestis acidaminivorans]